MRRPSKPDLSELTREQMEFIQAKVIELGSIEAVEEFYNLDDTVSEFAKIFAEAFYQE